jgi:serine/threonine-protein kinase RsbW
VPDPERIEELSIPSDPGRIRDARRWLAAVVGGAGWPGEDCHDLAVALSEACSNAHRYAYAGRTDGRVDLRLELFADHVVLQVRDYGTGFDLGRYEAPDLLRPTEGGYGIHLMRGLTDRVEYRQEKAGTSVRMAKTRRDRGDGSERDHERSEYEVQRVG